MAEKLTFNKLAFKTLTETAKLGEAATIVASLSFVAFGAIYALPILAAKAFGVMLITGGAYWGTRKVEIHGMNKLPGVMRSYKEKKPKEPLREEPIRTSTPDKPQNVEH